MLLGFLVIVGIIGFGFWLFGYYLWGVSIAIRSTGWPTATGEVISSEVCEHYGKTGTTYSPCLTYSYSVNGRIFESNLITGAHREPGSREDAELTVQMYAVGNKVKVFYDPSSPGIACLEPGVIPWEAYVAIVVGLGLSVFGLVVLRLFLTNLKALRPRPQPHG